MSSKSPSLVPSSSALAFDISAGNEEVGEMITDAIEKVSENGVITIEESNAMKTEIVFYFQNGH